MTKGSALWLIGSRLLRVPVNVAIIALLARLLGPAGVGLYALIQAAALMLHAGLLQWLQAPFVFFGRPEWENSGRIRTTLSARLPWLCVGIWMAIMLMLADPGAWMERLFHLSRDGVMLVPLALLWVWLMAEAQSLCEISGSLRALALAPLLSDVLVVLALSWIGFAGLHESLLHTLALTYSLSALVWAGLWLYAGRRARWGLERPAGDRMKSIIAYGWPLLPGLLISWVFEWSGPIILQHMLGQNEVGLYQVAFRINQAVLALSVPLSSVVVPQLLSRRGQDTDAIRKFIGTTAPALIVFWLLIILPALAVLPEIATLLAGERFGASAQVLGVLSLAVPGSIVVTLYGAVFTVQGRLLRMAVMYSLLMAGVNVLSTLMLVPYMGIMGAAVGCSLGYLALQAVYAIDQHRLLQVTLTPVAALFILAIMYLLLCVWLTDYPLSRAASAVLAVCGVCALARRYGLVRQEALLMLPGPAAAMRGVLAKLLCRNPSPDTGTSHG